MGTSCYCSFWTKYVYNYIITFYISLKMAYHEICWFILLPFRSVVRGLPVGLTAMQHGSTPEMCSKPTTQAANCSNGTVEQYYFDDAQCISFQACNTDPDNVTIFETMEACQINCIGLTLVQLLLTACTFSISSNSIL